jgi:small subunit ribosomal protein S8
MVDVLSDALNVIDVARQNGKASCVVRPVSSILTKLLEIMKENKYIKKYEIISDASGGFIKVDLSSAINKCKAVRPRLPIKAAEMGKYERRLLPALSFGIIVISTNKGLITNVEAKAKNVGGVLIAYVY